MPRLRRCFIAAKVGIVQEAARSGPCSKHRRRSGLASILITDLFIALCLAIPVSAQSNTASISGRALDPAQQPIPNAQILITNTDLNTKRTVVSDSNGDYRADRLPPGAFTLEAEAPNLKTRRPVRLTLGLGSTVHVDLALAIPSVTQKSTVTARGATSEGNTLAPPVNREEASVSSFFTGNTVTYLPNRDRDYTQFGQLSGGSRKILPKTASSLPVSAPPPSAFKSMVSASTTRSTADVAEHQTAHFSSPKPQSESSRSSAPASPQTSTAQTPASST